ncbi:polysaccharide pyruvyl transferase family protein [Gordonia sp. p3-SID1431]|uniref:polysaccharide pyruvyl transferase family protein n=1 Tax=Gordonia sp. p3-SID1431 TaxID=2916159 RepID=UPI0037C12E6D
MGDISHDSVRVLVLWADPSAENLGLRALAEGARALAVRVWSTDILTFHSHNTAGSPLTRRSVLRDIGRTRGPVKELLREFDVVLDTGGGDSFSDIYGLRRLMLQAYMYWAAGVVNVPVVMTPQTVGPFDSLLGRMIAKFVLRRSVFCATRDSVSADTVFTLTGKPPECVSTDLVFLAKPQTSSAPSATVSRVNTEPYLIVNVSGLLWDKNSHVDHLLYRDSVRTLISTFLARGYKVDLLAHVLDSPFPDNDVPVVRGLAAEFPGVDALVPASLESARDSLSQASIVVASRMHACLNALSVGTPAVAWAYSRKFRPLLSSIGWEHVYDLRVSADVVSSTSRLIARSNIDLLARDADRVSLEGYLMIDELVRVMKRLSIEAS